MKNIEPNQIKKAICIDFNDFNNLVLKLTNNTMKAAYQFYGMYYTTASDTNADRMSGDTITDLISDYYDINITSIHIDDDDSKNVWIIYDDESKTVS